jgi:hypothetical protein
MPSTHRQINARVTAAQLAAVTEAARRADTPLALFIRWALAIACAEHGVEFPDDMPAHGGARDPSSAESSPSSARGASR